MALTASQVRIAGTGELSLAPVGSTMPTTPTTALDSAFKSYGYTSEDGVVLSKNVTREGIPAWQSVSPVRWIITGQELVVATTFLQSNKDILKLWLNSGDFAVIGAGSNWKADIPVSPVGQEFAAVITWSDGALVSRLLVPKLEVTKTGDVPLKRGATLFPVDFTAVPPDSGNVLATWMTNDTAFDPA